MSVDLLQAITIICLNVMVILLTIRMRKLERLVILITEIQSANHVIVSALTQLQRKQP